MAFTRWPYVLSTDRYRRAEQGTSFPLRLARTLTHVRLLSVGIQRMRVEQFHMNVGRMAQLPPMSSMVNPVNPVRPSSLSTLPPIFPMDN
jgi:hypothetical protein